MSLEFHNTRMGHKFYTSDVPRIAEALENIAAELKRKNDMEDPELQPVPDWLQQETGSLVDTETRDELIETVATQVSLDLMEGDRDSFEELLRFCPMENLIGYLPDGLAEKYRRKS